MGDGSSKDKVIIDVKSAFKCYLDAALKNKDIIPDSENLNKTRKINISMTRDRINRLDVHVKRLKTTRSGL